MIPKIIHFFDSELLEGDLLEFNQNYHTIYQDFKLQFWSLEAIKKEASEIIKEFGYDIDQITNNSNYSFLFKYIILYKYGGMYFQNDIFPIKNIYSLVGDKAIVIYLEDNSNIKKNSISHHISPYFISCTVENKFVSQLLHDLFGILSVKRSELAGKMNEAEIIFNAYMRYNNASDIIILRTKFFYQLENAGIFSSNEYSDIDFRFVYGIKILNSKKRIKGEKIKTSLSLVIKNPHNQIEIWPKVSCLCISQNNEKLVRRCIKSFENQLYQNKELIIIYEDSSLSKNYISSLNRDNIKTYLVDSDKGKKSLGELRNISIHHSSGDYVMQWDDDDIYDPHRIVESMISLLKSGNKGCILDQLVMYDEVKDKYSFSKTRKWEGSILVEKETIVKEKIYYPDKAKGEDTPFFIMLEASFPITVLNDPWLYMYVTHNNNTFDYKHHDSLIERKFYFFKTYLNLQTLRLKYFRSLILEKIN